MPKYEAMFILQPNLNEERKKELYAQLDEAITKNNGEIVNANVWSQAKKLSYPIKKFQEGIYYLIIFKADPGAIQKLKQIYKLNENIIRLLLTKSE